MDASSQTFQQLKAHFEDYRAVTKTFLSSMQFFIDCVNNKYTSDLLINEKELKLYESFFELFNFNHFNVRSEVEIYAKKEAEISRAIEAITGVNAPRTESVALKTAQTPLKNDPERQIRKLQERVSKLKKQRDHARDANQRMHQQYLDALQKMEEQDFSRVGGQAVNRSFEILPHGDRGRAHSVALRNSDNNSLNNTFEILPNGRTVSVNAFHPEALNDSRSVSVVLDPKRSNSVLSNVLSTGSNNPDKEKNRARKRDIERHRSEIEMLNKEVTILKRELREERQEKAILAGTYERSVRLEKESSHHMIQNLKSRLDASKQDGLPPMSNQSAMQASDSNLDSVSRQDLDDLRASQIEMASMLSSKIVQKNQTVNMLKNSLNNMLTEKRKLQANLKERSNEIEDLQKRIGAMENRSVVAAKDFSELEATNSQLTTKFLMSVEREGDIMKKYNQMKMKVTALEKLVEKMKAQGDAKR
jgi:hypothetical protein